MHIYSEFEDHT